MRFALLGCLLLFALSAPVAAQQPGADLVKQADARFAAKDYAGARALYEQAEGQGNTDAMFWLGYLWQQGLGVAPDLAKSRAYYGTAAARNHREANFNLGFDLTDPAYPDKDFVRGRSYLERAWELGYADAASVLGRLYQNGQGVPVDLAAAADWYTKGAAAGSARSALPAARMYLHGTGVARDLALARKYAQQAQAAGFKSATGLLAEIAQAEAGKQAPPARAIELFNQAVAKYQAGDFAGSRALFEQSAALGNATAMYRVGAFHFYGDGVPVSADTGRQWYEKAVALRDADAAFSLAWQYADGILPRDYAQALKYYQLAHEFGSVGAGTNLGSLYQRGLGVPEDPVKSSEWTRRSAERGDPQGMANLGNNYRRGYGVAQDLVQARAWLEKAANAGNAWGKEVLAMLPPPPPAAPKVEAGQAEYDEGSKYFFSDKAKAFEWFSKAAALGHTQSRINVAAAYVQGEGVAMDARRGRALFLALAEEGDKYSQRTVAKLMMDGGGGPRDYDGARYWLERAANQDDREAMSLLGMMYDPANQRTPDMDLAVFWYQAAYARGYSIAEIWLKEKGLLQPPPAQQAFISRIESQGPDRSSSAAFHYDVAVYCQYGGSRCNALRGEAYRFQEANNRAAEAANMQRIWNVYKREAADPAVRSECLRKKSESIWRSNSGQQDWYYAGEC